MAQNIKVRCPQCDESFDLQDDVATGDITYCPSCYAELEVLDSKNGKVSLREAGGGYEDEEDHDTYHQEDEEY